VLLPVKPNIWYHFFGENPFFPQKRGTGPLFDEKGGTGPLFDTASPPFAEKRSSRQISNTDRKYQPPSKSDTGKIPIPKNLLVTPWYATLSFSFNSKLLLLINASPINWYIGQPWYYGTTSFSHPYSGLPYENPSVQAKLNYTSYTAFETIQQVSLGKFINRWRMRTLNLPRTPFNHKYSNPIVQCKIPFSAMWSWSFVPKPEDWPEQCRVVGAFTESSPIAAWCLRRSWWWMQQG
jgi:hypothetical protein